MNLDDPMPRLATQSASLRVGNQR